MKERFEPKVVGKGFSYMRRKVHENPKVFVGAKRVRFLLLGTTQNPRLQRVFYFTMKYGKISSVKILSFCRNFRMKYFLGAGLIALGVAIVLYTEWLLENFGTNAWAEEHFGTSGGSRLFYKLIGLIFVFIGFMIITGLFGPFLLATVGKLFVQR